MDYRLVQAMRSDTRRYGIVLKTIGAVTILESGRRAASLSERWSIIFEAGGKCISGGGAQWNKHEKKNT